MLKIFNKFIFFLSLFFFFACCTIQPLQDNNTNNIQDKEQKMLVEKRTSSIFVQTKISATLRDNTITSSITDMIEVRGTGFIIEENDNVSFILTAGHVCDITTKEQIQYLFPFYKNKKHTVTTKTLHIIKDINNDTHLALMIALDKENDLCLLVSPRLTHNTTIKISNEPLNIGEKVYSIGFPRGYYSDNYAIILSGYYSGEMYVNTSTSTKIRAFGLLSTNGSSGSPIINKNGDLVGVVVSNFREFDGVSLSPKFEIIKNFIEIGKYIYIIKKEEIDKETEYFLETKRKVDETVRKAEQDSR